MTPIKKRFIAALLATSTLTGCFTKVNDIPLQARPDAQPTRTITSFSASLRCMDQLFAQYGKTNFLITADGIPDATGEVSTGTKEMLITAISSMSVQSNGFNFVDYDTNSNVAVLASFVADPTTPNIPVPVGFEIPQFYIRGAITQLDDSVVAESASAGVGIPQADIGVSTDQVASVVAVDLNVGNVFTRQMMPGVSASNSIVVRRSGSAADAGATIDKLGLNFNLSFNRSEGMHQAVRTLIELSTIEILGKLTQIPYWRCLEIDQTNPAVERQARDWFRSMTRDERVRFTQRSLNALGFYRGLVTGELDGVTREAIGAYQSANQQIANGEINFDLYSALIAADFAVSQEPDTQLVPAAFEPRLAPEILPIGVSLTTQRQPANRFLAGETVSIQVETSQDAFTYCYYQDSFGQISRLFPNRFMPDPYLNARSQLQLPGGAPFDIVAETAGVNEEIMCYASREEIGLALPNELKIDDLTPLPVANFDQLMAAYKNAGATLGDARIDTGRLTINVIN